MSQFTKVLWAEGLFLRPQHLQMQDQYFEERLSKAINALHPYAFGIESVEIDLHLLSAGTLSFRQIVLTWQNGEPFNAPAVDNLPASITLDTSKLEDDVVVYLATPTIKMGGGNIHDPEKGSNGHYTLKQINAVDLYTKATTAEISVLSSQTHLVVGSVDEMEGVLTLPILRLKRTTAGTYDVNHNFIPPLLNIAASEVLVNMAQRIMSIMQSKITSLYAHHREAGKNQIEFRANDIASFYLLHTLNGAYSAILHLMQNLRFHPERLHQELLRLSGYLMSFGKHYALDDLPAYVHSQPLAGFQKLDLIIRDLLDTIISSRFLSIPLKEVKPTYYVGRIESDSANPNTRFYISVTSNTPAHELIKNVPMRFKVGAPVDVEQRVLAALPCASIVHVVQVPSAIPVRAGSVYFEIEPNGVLYDNMVKSESVCIYTANSAVDYKLELIAII